MKQTEKIEMFFNWLMDNNYFTINTIIMKIIFYLEKPMIMKLNGWINILKNMVECILIRRKKNWLRLINFL